MKFLKRLDLSPLSLIGIAGCLAVSTTMSLAEDESMEPYPMPGVISLENGWVKTITLDDGKPDPTWTYKDAKKLMQASDMNGDAKIDYLRLQKPANSFNHSVWTDTDHDGFFDKRMGGKLKVNIKVPQLADPTADGDLKLLAAATQRHALDQPFLMFEAKGEPHPLLTQAAHWEHTEPVGFDLMIKTRFTRYKKDELIRWTRKVPSPEHLHAFKDNRPKEVISDKHKTSYRAWSSVIRQDDTIQTYTLDTDHQSLFFGTLQPAGKNAWFHGMVRLERRRDEQLYRFDRSPFEHDNGKVTHIQLRQGLKRDDTPWLRISNEPFTTDYQSNDKFGVWVITLGAPQSPRHLYRIKWHDGPDVFSTTNTPIHGGAKAFLKHPLLRKHVDTQSPESVGRHFLNAIAAGDRQKAETLMHDSKGFWNGAKNSGFPYKPELAAALSKAANGTVVSMPDPNRSENMAHLVIGGIHLTLSRKEKTTAWNVHTGYLFSTRSGLTLPVKELGK